MNKKDMEQGFNTHRIPERMRHGLRSYIEDGVPPGDFLSAVLSNNLRRSFERADSENENLIVNYLRFLYNGAPSQAWGSPENVRDWIAAGGVKGQNIAWEPAPVRGFVEDEEIDIDAHWGR